jgi:hypothetical protein
MFHIDLIDESIEGLMGELSDHVKMFFQDCIKLSQHVFWKIDLFESFGENMNKEGYVFDFDDRNIKHLD